MIRARLLRLGAEDNVLLIVLHHIIADGWSIGVLFEEISKHYAAFVNDRQASFPEPGPQFSDVARWERWWCTTAAAARQLAYWAEHLRGAAPVFCSDGKPEGPRPDPRRAHEPVHLSEDLIGRLSNYGRIYGATLFMTLLAGLKAVLVIRTGRTDICVATATANRSQPGTDRVIGLFQNTTIVRTSIDPNLPFPEALRRVRNAILEAHARQEIPFDILAEHLSKQGLDPASLVQIYFTLQNPLRQPLELCDIATQGFGQIYREGQPVMPINDSWVSLMLKERPSSITGSCIYNPNLLKRRTVTHWMDDFSEILRNGVANPEAPLRRLLDC